MATIKLVEIIGTTRYIVSVNDTNVKINLWKGGYDKLEKFIQECEKVLLEKDFQKISRFLVEYGPNAPSTFCILSEFVFKNHFMTCFSEFGKTFMEQGRHFFAIKFCNLINPKGSKQLRTAYKSLFETAEQYFDCQIVFVELKNAFNHCSIKRVHKIYRALHSTRFYNVTKKLEHEFESYLHHCLLKLLESNQGINYTRLHKYAISPAVISFNNQNQELQKFFTRILTDNFEKNKKIKMNLGETYWVLPYNDLQLKRIKTFDFIDFIPILRNETQWYLLYWHKKGESAKSLARRFFNIKRIMLALQRLSPNWTSFLNVSYVEVLQVFDVLSQTRTSTNKKKYKLKTIQSSISEARILFDWLKNKDKKEGLNNPFRRLRLHNIDSFVENSHYMPEEIIDQITKVIHECPVYVQRMWLIMMNTGMRVSEVIGLEENCLVFKEKENTYYLTYLPYKVLKQRRKLGLDDYQDIPITSKETVNIIKQQIAETNELRRVGKTRYIFIMYAYKTVKELVTRPSGPNVIRSINNCIERHQIKDSKGNIWHYTNQQCRKTLAVRLLSEGHSVHDVGEVLGHMEEKTTRKYYQDVDAVKIAELDRQLFEELFTTIDETVLKAFSPSELEQIKQEIMIGARETPEGHGSCLKHVSFGPCKKRSCVGCSLLLTGPQKLPKWKKLYAEQKAYIEDMIETMKNQNITDYKNYRDYQAEQHLLELYEDTINKLEKFVKERI